MAFTVKARRAESETEPGRFVGTGPRTEDSDNWRAGDREVVPGGWVVPERAAASDGDAAADLLRVPSAEALSGRSVDASADRPVVELDEPEDGVVDRSCLLGRGRASLEAPAPCGRL